MDVRVRDPSLELSRPGHIRSSSGRKHVPDRDILNQLRINLGSIKRSLKHSREEILRKTVLEASLLGLASEGEARGVSSSLEDRLELSRGGAR